MFLDVGVLKVLMLWSGPLGMACLASPRQVLGVVRMQVVSAALVDDSVAVLISRSIGERHLVVERLLG